MGATGTGKSALALEIAKTRPTVIINADAMQLVRELRILTARPTDEEMAQAAHALYGALPACEPTSVARWLTLVEPVIRHAWEEGKLPMLVGGTGMYIKALTEGLARVPEIPDLIRERIRTMNHELRITKLHQLDPLMASRLKPGDTQRIARALEVIEATGVSLGDWQARSRAPLFPNARIYAAHLEWPRPQLYERLNQRFLTMLQHGAIEEAKHLMALGLDPSVPILRAHGVPELNAYLKGTLSLEQAMMKAQQNTRNYAKRQLTWLRNQLPHSLALNGQNLNASCETLLNVIKYA